MLPQIRLASPPAPEDGAIIGIKIPLCRKRVKSGKIMQYGLYFLHKVGVKSTRIVKISSRPSNMAAEHTQVWKSLNIP